MEEISIGAGLTQLIPLHQHDPIPSLTLAAPRLNSKANAGIAAPKHAARDAVSSCLCGTATAIGSLAPDSDGNEGTRPPRDVGGNLSQAVATTRTQGFGRFDPGARPV
jgi:hypothetical protein